MTPEEVIDFYKTGEYNKEIENRINGVVYSWQDSQEKILTVGEDITYYESLLTNNECVSKQFFKGKIVCRGIVQGKVLKILRLDNSIKVNKNSIILTHEGDPDLLPMIKKAGAIVCEQGGITCHMAIIAREYGIPCLIGVGNNVINTFKNGDQVEVDAINGYLKRRRL
jgi:pyruvate,water dikinase